MRMRFAIAVFISSSALLVAAGDRLRYEELHYTPPRVLSIEDRIILASIAEGLPPSIALERAWRESRFLPGLVSRTGDHGVMQLNARWFPPAVLHDNEANIRAGVRLLARYWRCYDDVAAVHRAYLHGPSGRCKQEGTPR